MKNDLRRTIVLILMICLLVFPACSIFGEQNSGNQQQNNDQNIQNQENQNTRKEGGRSRPEESNQEISNNNDVNTTNNEIEEETEPEEEDTEPPLDVAPHAPLSSSGPWYIVSNMEGLYAFNMDGSGMTLVTRGDPDNFHYLSQGASPSGGLFAFVTAENTYNNQALHVVDMSNNLNHIMIDLLSDDDVDIMAKRAIIDFPTFAWSHSGDLLAFFGAIDGPSSDLYVYSATDGSTTRLTSGPSQGYQPSWSPDDQYILHTGADNFGTGAGYSMSGVWAAAADDSGVITLPMPGDSADEVIVGWRDNDTFLSYTWSPAYGPHNLRFTNLHAGLAEEIWDHPFTDVGYGGGENSWVLLTIDEYAARENPQELMGTFTLSPPDYQPALLFEDIAGYIEPIGARAFLLYAGDEQYYIQANDFRDVSSMEGRKIFSTDGVPAWYSSNGLWANIGGQNVQITDEPVELACWGADSESILYSVDGHLHVTTAPDWEPVLVAAMFFPAEILLVP